MTPEISLPRITVAAIVPDGDRYLLVEERSEGQTVLNQPAGHLDPGETLIAAVIRETLEESAWDVEPVGLIGIYQLVLPHVHYVRMAFLCHPLRHHPERALDTDILRTHWMTRAELASGAISHRSPLVLRCIDDHQQGRRWPLEQIVEPVR